MKENQKVKFFTARMFGVVVTGRVLKVSKTGNRALVSWDNGFSSFKEKVHVSQLVKE